MTWTERHTDPHNLGKRVRQQEARIVRTDTARSLAASSIGAGGVRVNDRANITVDDGGRIIVRDGGQISIYYESGQGMFHAGQLVTRSDGDPIGRGLLIYKDAIDDDLLLEVSERTTGELYVIAGRSTNYLTQFLAYAVSAGIHASSSIILSTPETITATANVNIGADGHVRTITSAAGAKLDIVDLSVPPADVLLLESVVWRDRGQVERGEDAPLIAGFVADQVATVAESAPGLEPLVVRDAEGAPAGVAYDRVPAFHHKVLQAQAAEIAELKSTVAALMARLDALEAKDVG